MLIEIATILLLFTSLLLALFILTVRAPNKQPNTFLGIYFIVLAIHISVFIYSKYVVLLPVWEMLRDHIAFFTSPLLLLYFQSAIYSDFKLRPKHLLHLLPFLTEVAIFSPRFYFSDLATQRLFLENLNSSIEGKLSIVFGLGVSLFYLGLMFVELKKYQQILLENYSNKTNFNYRWLYQLLALLSVIYCFSLLKQGYKLYGADAEFLDMLRVILLLLLLGFLIWLVLKSMYNSEHFRNIHTDDQLVMEVLDEGSTREDGHDQEKIAMLLNFMEKEEPYLDASLTLNKLAKQTGILSRDLSLMINHDLKQHFFDFTNNYRIKKAKKMLLNPDFKALNIQQVMYEVGFNSKSSFYTAFKKQTGITPSQFRKKGSIK